MIADGAKSLPITNTEMTRFWFPMQEAIKFVLSSLAKMRGDGEIFIPNIPSIKIVDLAKAFEMPYNIIGLRKGEKIHEALTEDYTSDKNKFLSIDEIKRSIL
jgi:UDP-N-acetylglucosamine 4,6-dehydratase